MTEETKIQEQKPVEQEKPQEPIQTPNLEELAGKVREMAEKRLVDLEKNLKETEERIDKKLVELKKFVENTEISGKGLMLPVKTKDEEIKEGANKLLRGTGFSID